MKLYRKERSYRSMTNPDGQVSLSMTVVPRMYGVLLAGILLLLSVVMGWAFFGSINETAIVSGVDHPEAEASGEIIAFVPVSVGKAFEPGMAASVPFSF